MGIVAASYTKQYDTELLRIPQTNSYTRTQPFTRNGARQFMEKGERKANQRTGVDPVTDTEQELPTLPAQPLRAPIDNPACRAALIAERNLSLKAEWYQTRHAARQYNKSRGSARRVLTHSLPFCQPEYECSSPG